MDTGMDWMNEFDSKVPESIATLSSMETWERLVAAEPSLGRQLRYVGPDMWSMVRERLPEQVVIPEGGHAFPRTWTEFAAFCESWGYSIYDQNGIKQAIFDRMLDSAAAAYSHAFATFLSNSAGSVNDWFFVDGYFSDWYEFFAEMWKYKIERDHQAAANE